jgi:hypothetical protein
MENEKALYKYLFKNEEERTKIIIELEKYLNDAFKEIEIKFKELNEIPKNSTNKYEKYMENTLNELQKLNNELRKIESNVDCKENIKKDINKLLNLESLNYKNTINIYLNKLSCFDLIKKEEDAKLIQKEKEIANLKSNLGFIREEINDLLTNLKYSHM